MLSSPLNSTVGARNSSTHIPPSPERLEAQIRSLAYSRDTSFRSLIEELREQRRANEQLQEKMEGERRQWNDERQLLGQQKYEAERERDDSKRRLEFESNRYHSTSPVTSLLMFSFFFLFKVWLLFMICDTFVINF